MTTENFDKLVVQGFGDEWSRFDQSLLSSQELYAVFDSYFSIFPWELIGEDSIGFDVGCGSGRWAAVMSSKVKELHCIDASIDALEVAKKNLSGKNNCFFYHASVDAMPIEDDFYDFGYSLGVLHHIPDTQAGIDSCVRKLKQGAPILLYLYFSFDNKPFWYRLIWRLSELLRFIVSRSPSGLRYVLSQIVAFTIYLPLARISKVAEKIGLDTRNIPLSSYKDRSFYVMRTDALDRLGTRLEKRFSKKEITEMMISSGLQNISFKDSEAYWCAVGYKK
jgi:ubiquinone/menaquinone biosynthesis C-methylase UbiE